MKFAIVAIVYLLSARALACGPYLCQPVTCMTYGRTSLEGTLDNPCSQQDVDHLDPQNWTEENLSILADELSGSKTEDTPAGEEAACSSHGENPGNPKADPIALFQSLVEVSFGTNTPAADLIALRKNLGDGMIGKDQLLKLLETFEALPKEKKSSPAAEYLRALFALYSSDYPFVITSMESLRKANVPLMAEVALYTEARVRLLKAQSLWDGYASGKDKVDVLEAKRAEVLFAEYVRLYPKRGWTESAKGLIRRSKHLQGDLSGFLASWSDAIEQELAQRPRRRHCLSELFTELRFLPPQSLLELKSLHPILWLLRSYYVTRDYPLGPTGTADLEREPWRRAKMSSELALLEKDRGAFKKYPDLYAWSRAVLLVREKRFEEGYRLLQSQAVAKTNGGSLSWVTLNARFLMGLNRFDEARALIVKYANTHAASKKLSANQSTIYNFSSLDGFSLMTYVWQGKAHEAYHEGAALQIDAGLLLSFAQSGFATTELRGLLKNVKLQARLRKGLEAVTLKKHLMIADYDGFAKLWPSVKEAREEFMPLAESAVRLTKNPTDPVALYEVGRFLSLEPEPKMYAPCEKQALLPSKLNSPMKLFRESLMAFEKDQTKKDPVEAKLLAAMIRCFRHSYSAPFCFFDDASAPTKAERGRESKALFQRLHRRFPNSDAAKSTPVYW